MIDLRSQSLPQAVEFEYLDRGVKVEGTWHPILKMEWVEGTTLERYVEQKLDDPQALSVIATQFAQLLKDLTDREIAHGDLQHGNILLTDEAPGPRLRVIDYDAMWVPALRSHTSHELGHRNYQHPARTRHDYGPDTDAFSAWSITLSLASLAADPTLWRKLDAGDERLLLGKDDYRDPLSSKAFVTLGAVSTAPVSELADRVAHLAIGPSASGLPFPVLDGVSGTASSRIAATGTPWYRNVPHEWWRQRPTDLVLLSGTRHVERATAVVAALAVVLGLLAGVFGTAPDVYALGVVLLAGLSLSASVTVGYFYLPEVRGKYRTVRSCRDSRRAVRRAELELEQVDARETSATSEERARVRAIEDGMKQKAVAAQQHRTAKAEELRRTLGQAATEKKALRAKQQKALDRALRDIRAREATTLLRRQRSPPVRSLASAKPWQHDSGTPASRRQRISPASVSNASNTATVAPTRRRRSSGAMDARCASRESVRRRHRPWMPGAVGMSGPSKEDCRRSCQRRMNAASAIGPSRRPVTWTLAWPAPRSWHSATSSRAPRMPKPSEPHSTATYARRRSRSRRNRLRSASRAIVRRDDCPARRMRRTTASVTSGATRW